MIIELREIYKRSAINGANVVVGVIYYTQPLQVWIRKGGEFSVSMRFLNRSIGEAEAWLGPIKQIDASKINAVALAEEYTNVVQ